MIPYIFWPWFGLSCLILVRRRITGGSWKAQPREESTGPRDIEFPPPPPTDEADPMDPTHTADPIDVAPPSPPATEPAHATDAPQEPLPTETPTAVAVAPRDDDRPRSRTLAEAVEGIAMPCDLAPLMGDGALDPREVAFFTSGFDPATVGSALADELERLGYEITPVDDRSIRADQGPDMIRARLVSSALASDEVMKELHPSAPAGALVVELKLV